MPNYGLKKRQPEQDAGDDEQQIKRLKFDENRETEHDKDPACKLSENLESSADRGKCKQFLFKFLWIH